MNPQYYDLTTHINDKTPVYPGDPEFTFDQIQTIGKGSSYNLCHLHINNHMGTHVDFPSHAIKNGKTSDNYPLDHFIGEGIIAHVPAEIKNINAEFIMTLNISKNDFVFFKTNGAPLSVEAADLLIQKHIKFVGTNEINIEDDNNDDLPVHIKLLSHDILIVEGLYLEKIPVGRYKIYIMPIKIDSMDGLPARVFAEVI